MPMHVTHFRIVQSEQTGRYELEAEEGGKTVTLGVFDTLPQAKGFIMVDWDDQINTIGTCHSHHVWFYSTRHYPDRIEYD